MKTAIRYFFLFLLLMTLLIDLANAQRRGARVITEGTGPRVRLSGKTTGLSPIEMARINSSAKFYAESILMAEANANKAMWYGEPSPYFNAQPPRSLFQDNNSYNAALIQYNLMNHYRAMVSQTNQSLSLYPKNLQPQQAIANYREAVRRQQASAANLQNMLSEAATAFQRANPGPAYVDGGHSISNFHASRFSGKILGSRPYLGECATGVRQVFAAAGVKLGPTPNWRPGSYVWEKNVRPGTAIATFSDNAYGGHSAVLISKQGDGLVVWDQYPTARDKNGQATMVKPWGPRMIYYKDPTDTSVNNARRYRVINSSVENGD